MQEIDFCFSPVTKIYPKWIKVSNVKPKTMKLYEKKKKHDREILRHLQRAWLVVGLCGAQQSGCPQHICLSNMFALFT